MSNEYRRPTPQQIANGILQSGETPKSFLGMLGSMQREIREGGLRADVSCWETKTGFFEMAQRVYVDNGLPSLKDAELGLHMGKCERPGCCAMQQAYFEVLRPSQEADSPKIAKFLIELDDKLMLGKERPDLQGTDTHYDDSATGRGLKIIKAVDITDKGLITKNKEVHAELGLESILAYLSPVKGLAVNLRSSPKDGSGGIETIFHLQSLRPEDLDRWGETHFGIDPQFLYAIILANAPQIGDK